MVINWIGFIIIIFSLFLLKTVKTAELLSTYHQEDYDLKLTIVEVESYNHSYFKDLHASMVFFNRTSRVLDISGHILVDLTKNIKVTYQLYKFLSNEYRFFPLTLRVNGCDEFNRNTFGMAEMVKNHSNFRTCPPKKGFYHVRNAAVDASKLPPYIPRGQFKAVMEFSHNNDFMAKATAYTTISDKPLKWTN